MGRTERPCLGSPAIMEAGLFGVDTRYGSHAPQGIRPTGEHSVHPVGHILRCHLSVNGSSAMVLPVVVSNFIAERMTLGLILMPSSWPCTPE